MVETQEIEEEGKRPSKQREKVTQWTDGPEDLSEVPVAEKQKAGRDLMIVMILLIFSCSFSASLFWTLLWSKHMIMLALIIRLTNYFPWSELY